MLALLAVGVILSVLLSVITLILSASSLEVRAIQKELQEAWDYCAEMRQRVAKLEVAYLNSPLSIQARTQSRVKHATARRRGGKKK